MTKILLIAVFCMLSAALTKAGFNKEEAIKEFLTKSEECQGEVGATQADIDEMMKKEPASTKEGLCIRSCLMKKYGVMDGNGKFVKSVAMEHAEKYTDGDAEKMKCATEIIDFCGAISVPDDHCEASDVYLKCFKEQAKAHGVEKFDF